jgi:serine/threonine-protein kinase
MQSLPNEIWSDPGLEGKYRFERVVASGAMAIVVVARHLELDEKVAIKFLCPEAIRSNAAVSRFRREARAAAKIKNQHVVRIIDVSTTESGIPYFVMEYLDGMDLERVLRQYPDRRAPISDALDFVLQASEAIIEGHSLGIVHRDLKPANLFCVDRGDGYPQIKVLDFGISKFTTAPGDVERTDQYEILGSPRYMSPEQITSAWAVDHRTDIWALGVLLYEAIAGRAPFRDELIPELWRKIRQEAPEPLQELRPDCPLALAEVVHKCLEKDPNRRFADLSELARDLAPFAPDRSRASIARIRWTVDSNSDVSTRPSSYSDSYNRLAINTDARRRRNWLIGGAVVVSLGFGVILSLVQQAPNRDVTPPVPTVANVQHTFAVTPSTVVTPEPSPGLNTEPSKTSQFTTNAPELKDTHQEPFVRIPRRPNRTSTTPTSSSSAASSVPGSTPAPSTPREGTTNVPRVPAFLIDPIDDRNKDLP